MSGMRFSEDEIVLCTYVVLYDGYEFGGTLAIHDLTGRSFLSIKMKIRNMAAMLDANGIERSVNISPHKGAPSGRPARRTDWCIIEQLVSMPRTQLLSKCRSILP